MKQKCPPILRLQSRLLMLAVAVAMAVVSGLATPGAVRGNTQELPDDSFASALALMIRGYAHEHGGRAPASWVEMQAIVGDPAKMSPERRSQLRRYALLQPPMRYTFREGSDAGAEICLMMRRPFREVSTGTFPFYWLSPPRRYVILRYDDGTFHAMRLSEEEIQKIFRGRESLLPTPDTEPMRDRELSARLWNAICYALGGLTLFLLGRRLLRAARARATGPHAAAPELTGAGDKA